MWKRRAQALTPQNRAGTVYRVRIVRLAPAEELRKPIKLTNTSPAVSMYPRAAGCLNTSAAAETGCPPFSGRRLCERGSFVESKTRCSQSTRAEKTQQIWRHPLQRDALSQGWSQTGTRMNTVMMRDIA